MEEERDYIDMEEPTKIDFIKAIFNERENFYNIITGEFRQKIKSVSLDRDKKYNVFIKTLSTLEKDKQENIIQKVGDYTASINYENSKFLEEYYKEGFKDGLKLILQCLG